jgi:hypothetical protein
MNILATNFIIRVTPLTKFYSYDAGLSASLEKLSALQVVFVVKIIEIE